jgi:hypothetical protein
MARTPTFIREFVPYSTVKQNALKWSSYAASRISYNRNLLAREFGVDPDRVYSIFARNFKKHTKDFPLAAVDTGTEKNKRDYEKQEQYVLFLWNYYVVEKPKKPSLPKKPKETTVPVPPVEDSYVDPDNPYAGDIDDPPMIAEMSRIKPPRGGALVKRRARPKSQLVKRSGALARREDVQQKTYAPPTGKSGEDVLGDYPIPPRILELLVEYEAIPPGTYVDIDYDTYLGGVKNLLTRADPSYQLKDKIELSTEDSNLLQGELKKVSRTVEKGKKFRPNTKTVGKPTRRPATKPLRSMLGGAPEQPQQLLLPPGEDGKKKRKRKASLEENVAAIRKSVEKIFKALNGQFEAIKKQAELDRLNKQRERRRKRENALEGAGKFMLKQARKLAAPTFDLLDRLFKFLGTVILGRVLFKLVEWLGDKENQDKIEALGKFLKDWWPVLLSAFVLFATPLGGLIRSVLAGVVKLGMFMAKKAIPGLLRFVAKNPLAAAATVVVGGAAVGGIMQSQTQSNDAERAAQGKTQLDDTLEFGGATGDPMGALLFRSGGGQVAKYSGGGNVQRNKRTMPSGGKVTQSTGKRVKGAGKDTQMIVAQPGEIVMSKPAVDKIGAPFLLNLNKMGGGTNKPTFGKMSDIQFAQGGGVVGAKDIDMEKVMQTLRDAYITPDDLGPAGIDNPRIQNVANYLYGIEKLNTEGLDEFQIEDLQIAKKAYPKMDRNRRRKNPFASKGETQDKKEKKPKAKPRPMGRSAAKKRMEAKNKEEEGGMEAPSAKNNVAPSAAAAVITGAMPQTAQTAPAATAKPAPAMLGKGNLPPVPEPPKPKVNMMAAKVGSPPPSGESGGGSGGYRDVPTSFETFYQTDLRMQMLAIYGITEVE